MILPNERHSDAVTLMDFDVLTVTSIPAYFPSGVWAVWQEFRADKSQICDWLFQPQISVAEQFGTHWAHDVFATLNQRHWPCWRWINVANTLGEQ